MKSHWSATLRGVVLAGWDGDTEKVAIASIHGDPDIRAAALTAWMRCGELTPHRLANALRDESATVRRQAAECAARLPETSADVIDDLAEATGDSSTAVVDAACFALGELNSSSARVVPALVAVASEHDDVLCRESAVAALGAVGDPAALPTVLAACSDRATVRRRAVLALAAFDDPAATAKIEELLEDRDWQVRQAAEDLTAPPAD